MLFIRNNFMIQADLLVASSLRRTLVLPVRYSSFNGLKPIGYFLPFFLRDKSRSYSRFTIDDSRQCLLSFSPTGSVCGMNSLPSLA